MRRLLALIAALICTGCSALPGEEHSFAVALGINTTGGVWEACARVPTYQAGGGYMTLAAQGNSLGEAMALLNGVAPMTLHYGQVRMLVFGQELAASVEFAGVLQALAARGEVRQQAALCITADKLTDVMDALEPATGSRLSKSLEALLEARQQAGVLPKTTLSQMLRWGERQQAILADMALAPDDAAAQPGMDAPAGEQAAKDGGQIRLSGGWMLSANGQVQGRLTPMEMQLLSLLEGRLKQGTLALPEGTITLLDASSDLRLQGDAVHGHLLLRYSASSWSEEGLREALQHSLQALCGKLAAAGCDALGLARQAMASCRDMAQWHSINWPECYPALTWHFTIDIQREA